MELLLNIFIVLAVVVWEITKAIGQAFMVTFKWISQSVSWLWKVIDPLNLREREREAAIREAEFRGRCESEEAMREREERVRIWETRMSRMEEERTRRAKYAQKRRRDAIFDSMEKARSFAEEVENTNGWMRSEVWHWAEENYPEVCNEVKKLNNVVRHAKSPWRLKEARFRRADLIRKIKEAYSQTKHRFTY